MNFNETKAAQFKEDYGLLDSQISFWREAGTLPDILKDKDAVNRIGQEKRELVIRFLFLPWVKVSGFQNLGLVRRVDLLAYKTKPAKLSPWIVAILYKHLSDTDRSTLSPETPLEFIRRNASIIGGSSLGNEIGFNGNSVNYYCQKGYDKFKDESRNEKIYRLLFGGFCEFKPLEELVLS